MGCNLKCWKLLYCALIGVCAVFRSNTVYMYFTLYIRHHMFVCVEILPPSQPNGVMSSVVSLPNHTFTGQA